MTPPNYSAEFLHYEERRILPMIEVPVWEKSNLTLEEAAAYSGIGINKLRKMSDSESCPFVLWIGSKRLIKRRKLDEYIDRMYSI
jgi:excisionase family DNA binding protein